VIEFACTAEKHARTVFTQHGVFARFPGSLFVS
jgi:hypothetical protein